MIELNEQQQQDVNGARPHSGRHDPAWQKWFAQLDSFKGLVKGWNGYSANPPDLQAVELAAAFLLTLEGQHYPPAQIGPSVVGGVGITHRTGAKKVYVEFSNKGTAHALFSDAVSDPKVEKLTADAASFLALIQRVRAYLDE